MSDDEDDLDDPDEPVMDGSDDVFSNLELDSDYDDDMMDLGGQPSLGPLPDPGNVTALIQTAPHQHHHPQLPKPLTVSFNGE